MPPLRIGERVEEPDIDNRIELPFQTLEVERFLYQECCRHSPLSRLGPGFVDCRRGGVYAPHFMAPFGQEQGVLPLPHPTSRTVPRIWPSLSSFTTSISR